MLEAEINGAETALAIVGFDLDTLLALAGVFLGLAVVTQVLQEIYKYLSTSKARAFRIALGDFLGDWADKVVDDKKALPALRLRGPLQILQRWAPSHLLPMSKKDLQNALDKTSPEWVQKVLDALKKESALQGGVAAKASPVLNQVLQELWSFYEKERGARKIFDFFDTWEVVTKPAPTEVEQNQTDEGGPPESEAEAAANVKDERVEATLEPKWIPAVDAAWLLKAFRERFLPGWTKVEEEYDQFAANFDHAYRRRNLRHTVVFATLLALLVGLPFNELYSRARALSPEEITQLAESAVSLYEKGLEAENVRAAAETQTAEEALSPEAPSPPSEPEAGDAAEAEGPESTANASGEDAEVENDPIETTPQQDEASPSSAKPEDQLVDPDSPANSSDTAEPSDEDTEAGGPDAEESDDYLAELIQTLRGSLEPVLSSDREDIPIFRRGYDKLKALPWSKWPSYFGQCLITALLISFGAPLWHRLSKALLGVGRANLIRQPDHGSDRGSAQ